MTVHYTGWLKDGGSKFDSSVDRAQPFTFQLGGGQVIKGRDEGVDGMKIGEKRQLIIPAALGYGARGAGGYPSQRDAALRRGALEGGRISSLQSQMIRLIEELSLNAWPARQTACYDGWLLRFSEGFTRRANSVNPLYPLTLPVGAKIAFCEDVYRARARQPVFRLDGGSRAAGPGRAVERRGYARQADTHVQTLPLCPDPVPGEPDPEQGVSLAPELTEGWLTAYFAFNSHDAQTARSQRTAWQHPGPRLLRVGRARRRDRRGGPGHPGARLPGPVRHRDRGARAAAGAGDPGGADAGRLGPEARSRARLSAGDGEQPRRAPVTRSSASGRATATGIGWLRPCPAHEPGGPACLACARGGNNRGGREP